MGGEHDRSNSSCCNSVGSSPRGRGTLASSALAGKILRIIPAWAGNTWSARGPIISHSDHPRVGGEHIRQRVAGASKPGSSPRGRGTLSVLALKPRVHRIIPAWAGNTWDIDEKLELATDHPRVGGEHFPTLLTSPFSFGSSPRGRGTRRGSLSSTSSRRIIPAWAGNTYCA